MLRYLLLNNNSGPVYHAILIACRDYTGTEFSKLASTIEEAKSYKKILIDHYGFDSSNIKEIYNGGFREIVNGISSKLESLKENDNCILLFAGHGTYRQKGNEVIGYWVPLNAVDPDIDYVSNKKLDELIAGCRAKHILILSDACYGAAMRGGRTTGHESDNLSIAYQLKSRQILTSGGLEKVPGKSIFIQMVMKILQLNQDKYLDIQTLYHLIYDSVRDQTNLEPELRDFGSDGNEHGQFYFTKVR